MAIIRRSTIGKITRLLGFQDTSSFKTPVDMSGEQFRCYAWFVFTVTVLLESLFWFFGFCGFYSIHKHSSTPIWRLLGAFQCLTLFTARLIWKRMAAYRDKEVLSGAIVPAVLLGTSSCFLQCTTKLGSMIVAVCFVGAWIWNAASLWFVYWDEGSSLKLERYVALL